MFLTHGRPEAISQSEFDEASDALGDLRALFGVEQREARRAPQVGERLLFDDSAPVLRQYDELWDLLVPSRGQCTTLQGEVIRIAGRVGYEVYNDGGVSWGRTFTALLKQYEHIVASGEPLPLPSLARAAAAVASRNARSTDTRDVDVIAELAVQWVRLNPVLVVLDPPDVGR